jgi:hypothetical protein
MLNMSSYDDWQTTLTQIGKRLHLSSHCAFTSFNQTSTFDRSNFMTKCAKSTYCVHCRMRSDRCNCFLLDSDAAEQIRPGVDGPMNMFYKNFFCSKCQYTVKQCCCSDKTSKKPNARLYGLGKKKLPKRFVTWSECQCERLWTICDCEKMFDSSEYTTQTTRSGNGN